MATAPPRVLTVAGSDSGGGAGIQADLKTMLALGVHGMSAITAVTAQNSLGVQGVWPLPAEAVAAQIASVVDDIGVDAVKTGMLADVSITRQVVRCLEPVVGGGVPLVVDPVSVSKHGDPLLHPSAVAVLVAELLPLATVVTPNLDEAALLTGADTTDEAGRRRAIDVLLESGARWVLLKGGHLTGDAVDVLTDGSEIVELRAPRLDIRHTHGTGCTLASAIASRLAYGDDVVTAVRRAKDYVTAALAAGFALGSGIGPVDHGWMLR